MIEVTEKEIFNLFPTPIYRGTVKDESFLDNLKNNVLAIKQDTLGTEVSNDVNFETPDDLHERPEFQGLSELVLQESEKILNHFKLIRDSHYITGMWSMISGNNFSHQLHNHANCYLSGLIYLNAPVGCGNLVFRDPRPARSAMTYEYQEHDGLNSQSYYFKPKKGSIIFWPHWMDHGVERGTYVGDENRIMIAFNIMVRTEIKIKTSKLILR